MKNIVKRKSYVIALTLVLTASTLLAIFPIADAHVPAWTIPTYAYIVASPDPIGVGQTAFLVFWLDKVPPTAGGIGGDRWTGFTVKVTKPDGTTQTIGPMISDATSAAWSLYTPDQLGTYKFDFSFPGQTASLYHPTSGVRGSNSDYVNDTYLPSSASTTLTVQQEKVAQPPTYPLPTSYWTRPIEGQNTEWASIASHYLAGSSIIDAFQRNGIAPNSPHVMWTKPYQDGGIVGGNYWIPSAAYYTGLSYEGKLNNPVIMYGRLYYKTSLSDSASGGPYVCVDLRTGETLWSNDTISPNTGQLYLYESMNQHGVIGDGYLWQTSGTTMIAYDGRTGKWLFNMTGVPSGTEIRGPSGEITRYVLNVNGKWLALWNSSAEANTPLVLTPGNTTNAYQYRPVGKVANMSTAYTWNVTIPTLPAGSSIRKVIPDDMLLGSTSSTTGGSFGFGSTTYTVWAISLKPSNRGQLLWTKTYEPPAGNMTRSFGPVDPENRVFTMTDKETMQWLGFNLDNGNLMWGPVGDFRDFQYYGRVSNPPAPGFVGYGNLYVGGYGGELHCFDIKTGTLKWKYNDTYSGDQTPWGNYPLFVGTIADGKIYCYTSEHSPNVPLYKGSRIRCIDAYTGAEVWTLMGWYAIGSFGQTGIPIADGFMTYLNVYDMQVYCLGKGPSATTVTIQDDVVANGDTVLIKGTVVDQSPGAKQKMQTGEFNVVPAVADKDMGEWMEYIYMQKPMPQDATGVQIKLTAFDENGNPVEIGTATSDLSGNFATTWVPPAEGLYTIVASFDGSNSYWQSFAETHLAVTAAPASIITPQPTQTVAPTETPTTNASPTASPTVAPQPDQGLPSEMLLIAGAAIVIIAIVAAAAILLKRRI